MGGPKTRPSLRLTPDEDPTFVSEHVKVPPVPGIWEVAGDGLMKCTRLSSTLITEFTDV